MPCSRRPGTGITCRVIEALNIMEMHPKIAYLFQGREAQYPKNLEAKYPRIFTKIMDTWDTPAVDPIIEDLLIDKRGGRQGFPAEVMSEILMLGRIQDRLKEIREEKAGTGQPKDPWGQESVRRELAGQQIPYNQQGFFRSVDLGNEAAIMLFIRAGVEVEVRNPNGWTPLLAAAYIGSEKGADVLLKHGANVDAQDKQGYTPLHWAAFKGFPGMTKLLLDAKARPDAQSDMGLTPLHQAAMMGHVRIVEALLIAGAKVDVTNNEGCTPLHQAVADASVDVIKQLVAAGADMNIKDNTGASPLDLAKKRNKAPVLAALGVA